MNTTPQRRNIPTAGQVLAQQKIDAEREQARKVAFVTRSPAAPPPATKTAAPPTASTAIVPARNTAVAIPDTRTAQQAYLDEISPASIVGRLIKFSKDGQFITADDGEPVAADAEFIALCDQTLIGWLRFNDDAPPDRVMGLLYDGFIMPERPTLGDNDEADWPAGLSGQPEDPWKHQMCLVLQHTGTSELFTFTTISRTGRRAVGTLLRHFDRMLKHNPGELPIVRLKAGGFNHSDERVGWVPTPVFVPRGRAPRDSVATPDTSPAGDLNDEIPHL